MGKQNYDKTSEDCRCKICVMVSCVDEKPYAEEKKDDRKCISSNDSYCAEDEKHAKRREALCLDEDFFWPHFAACRSCGEQEKKKSEPAKKSDDECCVKKLYCFESCC